MTGIIEMLLLMAVGLTTALFARNLYLLQRCAYYWPPNWELLDEPGTKFSILLLRVVGTGLACFAVARWIISLS
jgi:hypothetical protein